jgi:hypothetical protein
MAAEARLHIRVATEHEAVQFLVKIEEFIEDAAHFEIEG